MPAPEASRRPDGTRVSDYDYELPEGLIARYPVERRDESRLLVVPRGGGDFRHLRFKDVVDLFRAGDVMVVNESRVLPARLLGKKPTGAPSEVLLIRPFAERLAGGMGAGSPASGSAAGSAVAGAGSPGSGSAAGSAVAGAAPAGASGAPAADSKLWEALVRPGGKLKPGRRVVVADDLTVEVLDSLEGGGRVVRLDTPLSTAQALERYGHVPLPPYLGREDEALDRERYQTVYARVPGSIAAPTAGLHFTPEVLSALDARGVERVALDLQVGVGTFRPVDAEDPTEHGMHAEPYHLSAAAAESINAARARGGSVWAVGTTVVRTLETVAREDGTVEAGGGQTALFVRPPYRFRVVDRLITNFHLPRSTLLMLVAAFAGFERTMAAYQEAIRNGYRFYSYGDAMAVID